ncbi:S8/S53 family peptidase [Tuwongella immobilis]|uniref:Peptidase s53 n=1 Tax=Tuwongella immobilis TaxID=692036 RepID=A0A6C2YSF7_9BACT|nr:hypothetical protein [Tuwongella immobilis]VIP04396.1 peptidase s53 : [Tuwongella immobilis]VTS06154.1 peptidase s53 : [Tuwongella immobilis]
MRACSVRCLGRIAWVVVAILCGPVTVMAQVRTPAPPAEYDVTLRYSINADRQGRILQFARMQQGLEALKFVEIPTEDSDVADLDPTAERMLGTIPSGNALKLLELPAIRTVLVAPKGSTWNAKADTNVPVRILLEQVATPRLQLQLWTQAQNQLAKMGFSPNIGYETYAYRIIRGRLPAGQIPLLLKDLRTLPSGWLMPETPIDTLPLPLRDTLAIRLIEVAPEPMDAPPAVSFSLPPAIPPDQANLRKLEPELLAIYQDAMNNPQPVRVEIIFSATVDLQERNWRGTLLGVNPSYAIEGQVGPVVTIFLPNAALLSELAGIDEIVHIRRPRPATGTLIAPMVPKLPGDASKVDPLAITKLDKLHAKRATGQGVRIIVIDTDFTGWDAAVGKELPEGTRYLDLTAELNPELKPLPPIGPRSKVGHGTQCAMAIALAAPNSLLTLVRIEPTSVHQVLTVARSAVADPRTSEAIQLRTDELNQFRDYLARRRLTVEELSRKAADNFDDDDAGRKLRADAVAAAEQLQREETEYTERLARLDALKSELALLNDAHIICNPLVWDSGMPVDGLSPMSRYLDEAYSKVRAKFVSNSNRVQRAPIWVQAGGDSLGTTWSSIFSDANGNGVMEFAPEAAKLPQDRWSRELNFLGLRGPDGQTSLDLPANARVRITMQWREPVDPTFPDPNDQAYRRPLADLRMLLLQQRDPKGETVSSDDLSIAGVTLGQPTRLLKLNEATVYEQRLELPLPVAGRYALRVEGMIPPTIRPEGDRELSQQYRWELRPKITIEVLDGTTAAKGAIVFADFPSMIGGVGIPGDVLAPVTVGAITANHRPAIDTALGSGPGTLLLIKPDFFTYEVFPKITGLGRARGTSLASGFAAGTCASLLSAGAPQSWLLESMRHQPGTTFTIPDVWLQPRQR